MAFYLIDFENIKNISDLTDLSEQDTIVFFYSQNANSLSFDLHIELNKSLAKKEYFMAQCGGKNALDFQMSSYIGFLISKFPEERIYIISKDKGFENLLSFWRAQGFETLEIRKNICENFKKEEIEPEGVENAPSKKTIKARADTLQEVLKNNAASLKLSKEHCEQIEKIVAGFKTRQAINNNLMKLFRDSDKVGKITKIIKPFLNNKK